MLWQAKFSVEFFFIKLALIPGLYLIEIAPKLFDRAKAFAVFIVFAKIDNSPGLWLPADNVDGYTPSVSEPSVKDAHKRFALR